jgi:hypothetical protein
LKNPRIRHFVIDELDDLSNDGDMTKSAHHTAKQIEDRALALGASPAAVYKWRERGVPSKWQIKLITESKGEIKPEDFGALKSGGDTQ